MSRPAKRQPAWLNRAVAALRLGKTKVQAAREAGVTYQQLNNVLRTLPDWSNVRPVKS